MIPLEISPGILNRSISITDQRTNVRFRSRLREQSIFTRWETVPICIRQFSLFPRAETILEGSFEKNESCWTERYINVSQIFPDMIMVYPVNAYATILLLGYSYNKNISY